MSTTEPLILLDPEDEHLRHLGWRVSRFGRNNLYAYLPKPGGGTRFLHRVLLGEPPCEVDHRNGNGLDNRRSNLRLATHAQNLANTRPRIGTSSRFKGVSWFRSKRRWEAYICVERQKRRLGYFHDEEAAARAYDAAALEAWGEFALTNEAAGLLAIGGH